MVSPHYSIMADLSFSRFPRDIFALVIHSFGLIYFTIITIGLLFDLFFLSLSDIHKTCLDFISLGYFLGGEIYLHIVPGLSLDHLYSRDVVNYATTIILIWTSSVPFLYFQFYFTPVLMWILIVLSTFSFVWLLAFVKFTHIEHDLVAASGIMHLIAILPAIYTLYVPSACRYALSAEYLKLILCNVLGSAIYLAQFPERFGYLVHSQISHFLMHVTMLIGATSFTGHLIDAYYSSPDFVELCYPTNI